MYCSKWGEEEIIIPSEDELDIENNNE